jgi:hypothetical protein
MSNHIDRGPMELWERSIPPGRAAENNPTNELEINVIFTDHQGTLGALKTAGALAHQLRAHINLLVPRVVPYAFPLASPPVSIQFTERRLLDLAHRGAQGPIVISVQLYLCRDPRLCLLEALKPRSLVVVGGRARWWPTKETKLARMLQFAGHRVIFAGLE